MMHPPCAMSIDVEDWFQVENLRGVIPRSTWRERHLRVERNVTAMLEMLAESSARSTFFVLGWIADRVPGLVRTIADSGHEVACHGFDHDLLSRLSPKEFRSDVDRARKLLQDLSGQSVLGYRAPSFSITEWGVDVLRELGFEYDSSAFPTIAHDRYGHLAGVSVRRPIMELRPGFHEINVSCLRVGGRGIPWGGGAYFRLMPYPVFGRGVKVILDAGAPFIFYIHPWEIDVGQPRLEGLAPSLRFRHYLNLDRCESRYRALLADFQWSTMGEVLADWKSGAQRVPHEVMVEG